MAKRTVCKKPHVSEIPVYPFSTGYFKYQKANGDVYVNGYAVLKMLIRAGLKEQAAELTVRLADVQNKD